MVNIPTEGNACVITCEQDSGSHRFCGLPECSGTYKKYNIRNHIGMTIEDRILIPTEIHVKGFYLLVHTSPNYCINLEGMAIYVSYKGHLFLLIYLFPFILPMNSMNLLSSGS